MSIPQNTSQISSFSGSENFGNGKDVKNAENFSSELPQNQEGFQSAMFRQSFDSALKDLLDKNKITHAKGNLLTVQFEKAKDPKTQLKVLGVLQELQNPVSAENTGFFRDKPHLAEVSDSVRLSPVLDEISIAKNQKNQYTAKNSAEAEEEQKKMMQEKMQELAKQQAEKEEAEKKQHARANKPKNNTTVASGEKKTSRKLIKWVAIGVAGSTAGLGFLV